MDVLIGCERFGIVRDAFLHAGHNAWSRDLVAAEGPHYAVNHCEYQGEKCPRLTVPSGHRYELCRATHAEAKLATDLTSKQIKSDGVVWLVGHYWACEPCASALKTIGATELRIKENV